MKIKWLLILISLAALMACAPKEAQKPSVNPPVFMPKPLDSEWSNWITGKWHGRGQSSIGGGTSIMIIQPALNGQFLMHTSECRLDEMTPEQTQNLRTMTGASDADIERFRKEGFREIRLETVDPASGEVHCYLFDSLRCIAVGRGRLEGNKQIIDWQWSVGGRGASTSITEKLDENTFRIGGVYKQDGKIIDDQESITMTRQSE
ncbi:MAG: hypothetical protein LLF76_00070 [Planctomycetaceae bacterium]|nr:hypothetical protein [Planctomycetaceae bacterium]